MGVFDIQLDPTVKMERVTKFPACGACQYKKENPPVPPRGKGRKHILIVGSMPSTSEAENGKLENGTGTQILSDALDNCDIDLWTDCVKMNAIACHGPTADIKYARYCRPLVLDRIQQMKPNLIILAGLPAIQSVIGKEWHNTIDTETPWLGAAIPSRRYNAWLCPVSHPLDVQRDEIKKKYFRYYIEKACDLRRNKPYGLDIPSDNNQVEIITATEGIRRVRKYLKYGGLCSMDYEATSLKPDNRKAYELYTAAICYEGKETIAFPMKDADRGTWREFLQSENLRKIFANAKYEQRASRACVGTWISNVVWDTMTAAHVLDNRPGICSLKFQTYINFGVGDYSSHIDFGDNGSNERNLIEKYNIRDVLLYNGLDALYTYRLAQKQAKDFGCILK